jgi:hypothetical protein
VIAVIRPGSGRTSPPSLNLHRQRARRTPMGSPPPTRNATPRTFSSRRCSDGTLLRWDVQFVFGIVGDGINSSKRSPVYRPHHLLVRPARVYDRRFPADFDFFFLLAFFGTFFPARRASDRPMAIACFLLFTVRPERPLFNVPRFRSCIAFSTLVLAALLYFLAIYISPCELQFGRGRSARSLRCPIFTSSIEIGSCPGS